jgi:hypothetical protein
MNRAITVTGKVGIPLKSKIAAWWMLIVGGISGAIGLTMILAMLAGESNTYDELDFILFVIFGLMGIGLFIVYFIPGLLVLKGGSWGWVVSLVILFLPMATIFGLLIKDIFYHYSESGFYPGYLGEHSLGFLALLPFLVPLTLILLDHTSYKLALLLPTLIAISYFGSLIVVKI